MFHWGCIVATPAYTNEVMFAAGGNPYGVSVKAGKENLNDNVKKEIAHQVRRNSFFVP